jgi:hypothetical protein
MDIREILQAAIQRTQQPKMTALQAPQAKGQVGSFDVENLLLNKADDLSIDHSKSEWKVSPENDKEDALKVIAHVKKQFDIAYTSRLEMELEWTQALAFFEGRQWFRINSQTRNLVNLQNPNEGARYVTVNKMRPLIDGVVGKLTQCAPDARAVPLSYSEFDQKASEEANFIAGHYTRKFGRETQTKERVRWACVTGTSFVKVWWNAKAEQVVPEYSIMDGSVTGFKSMAIGDVEEQIVPCFNIYLDPVAQTDDQVRWLIHASIRPLSWFVDSYGEAGKKVVPDAIAGDNAGYVDAYLEGLGNTGYGWVQPSSARLNNADHKRKAAVVYEYWEKPTEQYPEGRFIVSTNGALLYAGVWPYEKKDEFPFIPLRWQPRSGTPYGHSLGFDLCPLQLTYNRLYSRAVEQFETTKDYVMVERNSNIGADAFNNTSDDIEDKNRTYRKVYFNRGTHPPQIMRAPGISGDLFPFMQTVEKDMMDVAGLHDVSQGQAQAGTPAESVKLLQRADNTQHSYIRADIEISIAKIKEWEIALVKEFAPAPFVGSVDDQINSKSPAQQGIVDFQAIREGGLYKVVYVPGSSQEDSPDQKLQKIAALRQMGLFGDPADPETNALVVKMLQLPETGEILEHLARQAEKQQQQQQQMMEMQQQQQQMQQQQMEQQGQPRGPQYDPEAEGHRAELDMQKQTTLAEQKAQMEQAKMQMQSQQKQEEYAAQKIADINHAMAMQAVSPEPKQSSTSGGKQKPRPANKN